VLGTAEAGWASRITWGLVIPALFTSQLVTSLTCEGSGWSGSSTRSCFRFH
jgi:hypothetical protein